MARKKKEITPKHSTKTLSEALGVDKILQSLNMNI